MSFSDMGNCCCWWWGEQLPSTNVGPSVTAVQEVGAAGGPWPMEGPPAALDQEMKLMALVHISSHFNWAKRSKKKQKKIIIGEKKEGF